MSPTCIVLCLCLQSGNCCCNQLFVCLYSFYCLDYAFASIDGYTKTSLVTVTDWTRNSQTLRQCDFGSERDSNCWPPRHDSSSGGYLVYSRSDNPSVSFTYNSFTIIGHSPMLVLQVPIPGHQQLQNFQFIQPARHLDYKTPHGSFVFVFFYCPSYA